MQPPDPPRLHVLMGPSGCGKSTVGTALSELTGWPFIEGDDHHSAENIAKQSRAEPLTDGDRAAWIDSILQGIRAHPEQPVWLACSALTPYVQGRLREESGRPTVFILLNVSENRLVRRMNARTRHFMPAQLLQSQLSTLQPPVDAIVVNADQESGRLASEIIERLQINIDQASHAATSKGDNRDPPSR